MYLVIGRENCPFCDKAKKLLTDKGLGYVYVDMTSGDSITDNVWKNLLVNDLKVKTVPQVFNLTGGYNELTQELNND